MIEPTLGDAPIKKDFAMRLASDSITEQSKVVLELQRLRMAVVFSTIVILGGLAAVVVAITGIDWFNPAILFIVVSYFAWNRVGC